MLSILDRASCETNVLAVISSAWPLGVPRAALVPEFQSLTALSAGPVEERLPNHSSTVGNMVSRVVISGIFRG
jgi:hypothetical protein